MFLHIPSTQVIDVRFNVILLQFRSYEAATPFDLYEHLQSSMNTSSQLRTNISIKTMMETWTNQPSFPIVTVTRDYEQQTASVSQKRFCENLDLCDRETDEWWVPLNFASKSSLADFSRTSARGWLKPEDRSFTVGPFASEDWVVFNVQQTGYYRVNYDERNWQMLIDDLNSKDFRRIHKVNRASLVDDAFNLAKGGYIDYSIAFHLSNYLAQEVDYEPWLAAVNNFKFLNRMLSNAPDVQRAFQVSEFRLHSCAFEE